MGVLAGVVGVHTGQTTTYGPRVTLNTGLWPSVTPEGLKHKSACCHSGVESAGQGCPSSAVVLTTGLTDGGGVFGAGSRPLLVKVVVQVPSCGESRADKLMEKR